MIRDNTHVLHDEFGLTKHLGINALQNKMFFAFGLTCHEEGVIDVATAEFSDFYDFARWVEPLCNGNRIVHQSKGNPDFFQPSTPSLKALAFVKPCELYSPATLAALFSAGQLQ